MNATANTAATTADVADSAPSQPTQVPMKDLFTCKGGREPKGMVQVFANASAYVPKLIQHLFGADELKTMMVWFFTGVMRVLFIGGPAGCGKSSLVEQFAARLKIAVFRVGCHRQLRMEDLRGQFTLKVRDGQQVTEFVYGPLVRAYRDGGILLLDEGDSLDPTVMLGLNTVFDGAPLIIPETDEIIECHPQFRVVITGNTMGLGDESGVMKGTTRQNFAVMDRMGLIQASYMDPLDETRVLHVACNQKLGGKIIQQMVELANTVRDAAQELNSRNRPEVVISTRGLIRWGSLLTMHMGPDGKIEDDKVIATLDTALLGKAKPTDRQFVLSMAQRHGLITKLPA